MHSHNYFLKGTALKIEFAFDAESGALSLKETSDNKDESLSVFTLPQSLSTRQTEKVAKILGGMVRSNGEAFQVVVNFVLGLVARGEDVSIAQLAEELKEDPEAVRMLTVGSGELLEYVGSEGVLPRFTAALFLKDGERFTDELYKERTELFYDAPFECVWKGIRYFLSQKSGLLKNTRSLLNQPETTVAA